MPEGMNYDVVIVGAGPAGLAAGIRLRQLSAQSGRPLTVCILEKGGEVGAHILSGAVIETRALDELLPGWQDQGAPAGVAVKEDRFLFLTRNHAIRLPTPPQMRNHKGNRIVSLGNLTRWLGQQAEQAGVEIFPGFPAADLIIENGRLAGVKTGEFGRAKDGSEKPSYQPPMEVRGTYTFLAEGCRGSLSQRLMREFSLRNACDPQTYAIGIKELWQVRPENHREGEVVHSIGWPLDAGTYGGSFIYHAEANTVAIGYITALDYANPHLDPYLEFQRFKTHPAIAPLLEGGKRISYGARALNEGGLQSIPQTAFPGGALIGCSAGFLNVAKIKGSHSAVKSGMLAAQAAFAALGRPQPEPVLTAYTESLKASWIYDELSKARNIRPGFRFGLYAGLLHAAIDTYILRGRAPWTLHHHADHKSLRPKDACRKPDYARPDGVRTFDRMGSVFLSGTNHEENQPSHLLLKDPDVPVQVNLKLYDAPEQRYCPAGVYEIVQEATGPALHIHAQNCVHCKTCDIKDPSQNIVWVTPEGGGGPNYSGM